MFSTLGFGNTDANLFMDAKGSRLSRGLPNYTSVITPQGTARAWSLLRAGVPLTLLCDLVDPEGPPSRQIYTAEMVADDVAADPATDPATDTARAHPAGRSIVLPEVSIYTA
ncbi:MAG: hypothetical protein ACJ72Y_00205 [Actinomycetes bacterium]